MGFKIQGASGVDAEVDSSGNLKTTLTNVDSETGKVRLMTENDAGTITGTVYLKSPETSLDYRLRVGIDTLMFSDEFNATTQNTSLYKHLFTTMTMAQSSGSLLTNANLTASTATGCSLQTWKAIPMIVGSSIYVETCIAITAVPLVNQVLQWGLGTPTATAAPTDGVFFKLTTAGLVCVVVYMGNSWESGTLLPAASIPIGDTKRYGMSISAHEVELWIDDVMLGEFDLPTANPLPFGSAALPMFVQQYNTNTVSGSPQMQAKIGAWAAYIADIGTNKTWAGQMAAQGLNASQGQNGGTMGQSAQWSNTALPTAAAGTNTTAALGTGLGGLFQLNAMATSGTDVIVSSFQNPVGSVTQSPSNLHVRGVWMDVVNIGAAVATTATVLAIALAYGHTALSLATTESASFANNTTKAPRRLPLGTACFKVGDVIGASQRIAVDFETPVVVNPGEYVAVIAKPVVGTATASEVFIFNIGFNAYYE